MRKIKQTERPYVIVYSNGKRELRDSAVSLPQARVRARLRFARIKGEVATIYRAMELIEVLSP